MSAEENSSYLNTELLDRIAENKPLVHQITNYVTVNDCAQITLHWGALPVMAHSRREAGEMAKSAAALVLNIGTLDEGVQEGMLVAGRAANSAGIPVVLDPVGVGATSYRTEFARRLLQQLDVDVIKGNRGEISVLARNEGQVRGVEAVGEYSELEETALSLAAEQNAAVVITGPGDIVAGPGEVELVRGGHKLLGRNVGTGCMLASTLGVFMGAAEADSEVDSEVDSGAVKNLLSPAVTAVAAFAAAAGSAGENAERPASFLQEFFDVISEFDPALISRYVEVERL